MRARTGVGILRFDDQPRTESTASRSPSASVRRSSRRSLSGLNRVAPPPPASNALAQFRAAFSTTLAVGSSPSAPVPSVLLPPMEQNISTLYDPDILTVQRCQFPTCVESTSTYVYTPSLPRMIFGQSGWERRGAGTSSLCRLKMRPPSGTASCLLSTALRARRGGPETTENQRGRGGGWKDH
jgi:hypothetical protein